MKKPPFSPNSKVSGYSIEPSRVILYGKDNTCRIYDTANVGYEKLAMIKVVVLSGQVEMLWEKQYEIVA